MRRPARRSAAQPADAGVCDYLFFDYDNDGWLDIFVANGHIENEIERIQKRVKYAAVAAAVSQPGERELRRSDAVGWS